MDRVFQLATDRTLVVITHAPEKLFPVDAAFTFRDGRSRTFPYLRVAAGFRTWKVRLHCTGEEGPNSMKMAR
jgi:hypothetical protein